MITHRRLALVLLLFTLLVPAAPVVAGHATGQHWPNGQIEIHDYTSPFFDFMLVDAVANWDNTSPSLTLTLIDEGEMACPGFTAGIVVVCSGNYNNPDWAGRAWYHSSGSHIIDGAIRFDTADFAGRESDGPWVLHLGCHEVGHMMGLNHQNTSGSCVTDSNLRRYPGDHDVNTMLAVYDGHAEASADTASAPSDLKVFDSFSDAPTAATADSVDPS